MTYSEKLKDPRWQKKRLQILERDNWKCTQCGSDKRTLHVHHLVYFKGKEPWDYDDDALIVLCEPCHEREEAFKRANPDVYNYASSAKMTVMDVMILVGGLCFAKKFDVEAFKSISDLHKQSVVRKYTKQLVSFFNDPHTDLADEMVSIKNGEEIHSN